MGNLIRKKKNQTSLLAIIMKAVYGIGFGILALTACVLIFLSIVAEKHIVSSEIFPDLEFAIVIGYLCVVISIIFFIPFVTARKLRKKGQSIIEIAEKIKAQDLNCEIRLSGVAEIDQILHSMDDMRQALKDALEAQWRMEQNRKEQIGALAHDVRTPITVLKGNIDLLRASALDDVSKEYADDAKIGLEQMEEYLSQLLEMTRAERGYIVKLQLVNLCQLLDETVSMLSRIADKKEIKMLTKMETESIFIMADAELVKRMFQNLISNALDFTPNNGTIKICLDTDETKAVVTMIDSGCGFSPNALKHGMEQFYMDDTSRSRTNHYGLGLYIVHTIISQHNGMIQLANDDATGGAMVTIQIPLIKEEN